MHKGNTRDRHVALDGAIEPLQRVVRVWPLCVPSGFAGHCGAAMAFLSASWSEGAAPRATHTCTERAPLGPRLTGALHRVVFMHVHDLLGAARTVALRGIGGRRKLCGFMHLAYADVPSHGPSCTTCPP